MTTIEYVRRDDGKVSWVVCENGHIVADYPSKWEALDEYPDAVEITPKRLEKRVESEAEKTRALMIALTMAVLSGLFFVVLMITNIWGALIATFVFASLIAGVKSLGTKST